MANNRCPDCNKFVSTEIEVTDVTFNDGALEDGNISLNLTVSLSKNCAECGAELSTRVIEVGLNTKIDPDELKGDWEGF